VLLALLGLLFVAVAASAWPVVRRLTRRLEALQRGVEVFGRGQLGQRVPEDGRDEVAALAHSFNRTAERIEKLVQANRSLLANASHELRSPLARLKMAVAVIDRSDAARREELRAEIDRNIRELDALVEEVLLASRLDASHQLHRDPVDLLGLLAEEAARVGAEVDGEALTLPGDERLLRRAMRNLLENARRYGGDEVIATLTPRPQGVELRVCDRGPGVPEAYRERVFEPFFRLPGHAEREGGVGLGLSLVRQIAEQHGGQVRCEAREGGGSCFVLSLPMPSAAERA
jgi:signal transduction histidine kinase